MLPQVSRAGHCAAHDKVAQRSQLRDTGQQLKLACKGARAMDRCCACALNQQGGLPSCGTVGNAQTQIEGSQGSQENNSSSSNLLLTESTASSHISIQQLQAAQLGAGC